MEVGGLLKGEGGISTARRKEGTRKGEVSDPHSQNSKVQPRRIVILQSRRKAILRPTHHRPNERIPWHERRGSASRGRRGRPRSPSTTATAPRDTLRVVLAADGAGVAARAGRGARPAGAAALAPGVGDGLGGGFEGEDDRDEKEEIHTDLWATLFALSLWACITL